jgi:hypothetical protein
VLLSFREINTIAILDLESEAIVWAARGPWLRQHDPDLLANGNILLFDNQGHVGPGGITRVIEFDPATGRVEWSYAGTARERFESEVRSSQERLANGNTLITESDGGRLFEITPAGEVVWNFVNPVRGGAGGELVPIVAWAQRIDPDTLTADFRALLLGAEAGGTEGTGAGADPRAQAGRRDTAAPIRRLSAASCRHHLPQRKTASLRAPPVEVDLHRHGRGPSSAMGDAPRVGVASAD